MKDDEEITFFTIQKLIKKVYLKEFGQTTVPSALEATLEPKVVEPVVQAVTTPEKSKKKGGKAA